MADWRVAKSLDKLLAQINEKYPGRSKDSDGSIGNAEHKTHDSDHNAWVMDGDMGVVTARDYTHDPAHGFNSYAFADHLIEVRDPRIKYVISNRRIAGNEGYAKRNHAVAWQWAHYGGKNAHDHHVHVSVESTKPLYDSVADWNVDAPAGPLPPVIPGTKPRRPTIRRGMFGPDVAYLKRMLGVVGTDEFDSKTEQAVIDFQRKYNLVPDGIVGQYTWEMIER